MLLEKSGSFLFLPIFVGWHMEGSFEYLGEVGIVVEIGGWGDLLDGIVGSGGAGRLFPGGYAAGFGRVSVGICVL